MNNYTLSQIRNVAETAVYFSMPSKCVLKEVPGIKKFFVTDTLAVRAENGKLPLYVIVNHKQYLMSNCVVEPL